MIHSGVEGDALLNVLVADYQPTTVLSLAQSEDTLFAVIDHTTIEGEEGVEGLYTGLFVPFDCDPDCDPSQDVSNDGSGISLEHVWPRSMGADAGNAERDMHHLFPSRNAVSDARGNLPFGESPDEETTAWYYLDQESSTPPVEERDLWSERQGAVLFEPREEKKGDVARALFYFFTVYGPFGTDQADRAFFAGMRDTLLTWHEADLPTEEEIARSERVAQYQTTGSGEPAINPFVHDSTLARRALYSETLATPTVFVNAEATGAQTGRSWLHAFTTIQDAFRRAQIYGDDAVQEVWVAEGTYYPTNDDINSDDPREATFNLRNGLAVYGGFGGTEASLEERDWETHPTVLSGDIAAVGDDNDNAYHVVYASHGVDTTAVLDGFVITKGRADEDDDGEHGTGGGFLCPGSPTLRNLRVLDNYALYFGGGGHVTSAARLSGIVFEQNVAGINGGGLYAEPSRFGSGTVKLTDATFIQNIAHHGGGLFWDGQSFDDVGGIIENVTFEGNVADAEEGWGGGMRSFGPITVTGASFTGNSAYAGGGYGASGDFEFEMRRALFSANEATYGGGVAILGGETATFRNAQFIGNVASEAGGGYFCGRMTPSSPRGGGANIVGAVFKHNRAAQGGGMACAGSFASTAGVNTSLLGNTAERGGAIGSEGGPDWLIANTIIAGNDAEQGATIYSDDSHMSLVNVTAMGNAGGVRLIERGNFTLQNSIIWGNETGDDHTIEHEDYIRIWLWDNIIDGGCPGGPGDIACAGLSEEDPLVGALPHPGGDGMWGTDDDDYGELRLQAASPAVNDGQESRLPSDFVDLDEDGDRTEPIPYDYAGAPRIQDGSPDLGAYEGGYVTVDVEPTAGVPTRDALLPPYPNPSASRATVGIALAEGRSRVLVEVYDVLGRRVETLHDGPLSAGQHDITLDGIRLPAGVYVVRATGDGFAKHRRVTLLR